MTRLHVSDPDPNLPHRGAAKPCLFQYWDSEKIPDYVADLIATFRKRNPDFHHVVFSRARTEDFINTHFGSRELEAFRACVVPAMQSDYFRYCAALKLGGVYSDVDYRCVKSLRPLLDRCTGGELFLHPIDRSLDGRPVQVVLSGFFAFREPDHPFLRLALEIASANVESRIAERLCPVGRNAQWGISLTTGPGIFTLMRLIYEWGSFDAFIEGIAGSVAEPFGKLYCETIGGYDRIVEAFSEIRMSPIERMYGWIAEPDSTLPYKATDSHWLNVKTEIFRRSSR